MSDSKTLNELRGEYESAKLHVIEAARQAVNLFGNDDPKRAVILTRTALNRLDAATAAYFHAAGVE